MLEGVKQPVLLCPTKIAVLQAKEDSKATAKEDPKAKTEQEDSKK